MRCTPSALAGAALALLAGRAGAQCPPGSFEHTDRHEVSHHAPIVGYGPMHLALPRWDPAQHPPGSRLVRAELSFSTRAHVDLCVENTSLVETCTYQWTAFFDAHFGGHALLELPPGSLHASLSAATDLDSFDGVLDYAGSSGESWLDQDDLEALPVFVESEPLELRDWTGDGQLAFQHSATGALIATSPCTYLRTTHSASAAVTLRIEYVWCGPSLGLAYCFGDGSGAACPCGNAGGTGAGCASSNGAGARLFASGSASAGADDLVLEGGGLVAGQPVLAFAGLQRVAGGAGAPFGDGLRCAGGDVRRLGVELADSAGTTRHGPGLIALGGLSAGETRRFQLWYRDPAGPCAGGFNLSPGLELALAP